jgi:hypothetical protein
MVQIPLRFTFDAFKLISSMSTYKNWTEYHHKINLIFHGIVAITMLPFIWLLMESQTSQLAVVSNDPVIIIFFGLTCIVLSAVAYMYKKRNLPGAVNQEQLRSKLDSYTTTLIIHFAFLEGAALLSTLALYLTSHTLFIVLYILILFVFSLSRPNMDRTFRELQLNRQEREIISERKEIAP